MAKKIFSLGRKLPIDAVENISLDSSRSLLDADIIVFEPNFNDFIRDGDYKNRPMLTDESSFRCRDAMKHWRFQLEECCIAGKMVVIYLSEFEEVAICEDREALSKRNQNKASDLVFVVNNYGFLPVAIANAKYVNGKEIKPCGDHKFIANYWNTFASYSKYCVYFDSNDLMPLLVTKSGDKPVGAVQVLHEGTLIMLPSINYEDSRIIAETTKCTVTIDEDGNDVDEYWSESTWTDHGKDIVSRLIHSFVEIDKVLRSGRTITPVPEWAQQSSYRMSEEATLEARIKETSEQIETLHAERAVLQNVLENAGNLRWLLYESGHPLEEAIIKALRLLGFKAETYKKGDSEFDIVFISEEGRFLGEAEGKHNKAVNIDKLDQLERNLREDFKREEVTEYAKGILFGNAYLLSPPAERAEFFTAKCLIGAERSGIALVRTPDLFDIAKYLKENKDEEFAKQCREAFRDTKGQILQFPPVPIDSVMVVSEGHDAPEPDDAANL